VAFDPVPIAIGNGAVLQDDVFRVFANAATRDSEGVVLPGQFKTTALGSPGAAVSIAPGGLVVRNAQKTGESYIGRAQTATQVSISPNNGGSTRRDLVLARIIDPDYSPWQPSGTPGAPNTSVPNGPYFEPYVLSGVGAVTNAAQAGITYSAVALARVDMPAGAQTVQSGYITDLRQLAQPRIGFAYDVQTVASSQQLLVTDTTVKDWPLNSLQVYVPRWATHAQVGITLLTVGTDGNASDFSPRVYVGGATVVSAAWDYNGGGTDHYAGVEKLPFQMYGEFNVVAAQDSIITVKPQAQRTFTSNTGLVVMDTTGLVVFDVRFSERVV
jgi:hypothetical protein